MKIKYICLRCKSDQVGQDAFCDWNIETQQWEIANMMGEMFCHTCCHSTELVEFPIEEEEP